MSAGYERQQQGRRYSSEGTDQGDWRRREQHGRSPYSRAQEGYERDYTDEFESRSPRDEDERAGMGRRFDEGSRHGEYDQPMADYGQREYQRRQGRADFGQGDFRRQYRDEQFGGQGGYGQGSYGQGSYGQGSYREGFHRQSDYGRGEFDRGDYGSPRQAGGEFGVGYDYGDEGSGSYRQQRSGRQFGQGAGQAGGATGFRGKGPRGYRRSDERIEEEINQSLTDHDEIDAEDIEVKVSSGEVTLSGSVDCRRAKWLAEDLAERISGVTEVQNQIRLRRGQQGESGRSSGSTMGGNASSKQGESTASAETGNRKSHR